MIKKFYYLLLILLSGFILIYFLLPMIFYYNFYDKDVDQADFDKSIRMTPLLIAARGGDINTVNTLIEKGENPDQDSADGWTALMFAAKNGHIDIVKNLLVSGANPDMISNKDTPINYVYSVTTALSAAINNKHFDIAKIIIENNVTIRSYSLIAAGKHGSVEFWEYLKSKDKNINLNAYNKSLYTKTPLLSAVEYDNDQVIHWLIKNGVDPNAVIENRIAPIGWASTFSRHKAVKALLENGADPNTVLPKSYSTENKRTPLTVITSRFSNPKVDYEIVKSLLQFGANKNFRGDYENLTPAEYMKKNIKIRESLLEEIKKDKETGYKKYGYSDNLLKSRLDGYHYMVSAMNLLK